MEGAQVPPRDIFCGGVVKSFRAQAISLNTMRQKLHNRGSSEVKRENFRDILNVSVLEYL